MHELPKELRDLELSLQALSPAPARLDRDRVMFLAGQAAARRQNRLRWLWPLATAASLLVAVGLAGRLAMAPRAGGDAPGGLAAVAPPESDEAARQLTAYLQLRERLLVQGVDALPDSPRRATDTAPPNRIDELRHWLKS